MGMLLMRIFQPIRQVKKIREIVRNKILTDSYWSSDIYRADHAAHHHGARPSDPGGHPARALALRRLFHRHLDDRLYRLGGDHRPKFHPPGGLCGNGMARPGPLAVLPDERNLPMRIGFGSLETGQTAA